MLRLLDEIGTEECLLSEVALWKRKCEREILRSEKLERRVASQARELERIRTTLYKDRVEEFDRVRRGEG